MKIESGYEEEICKGALILAVLDKMEVIHCVCVMIMLPWHDYIIGHNAYIGHPPIMRRRGDTSLSS